jgi:hypothetical protein
LAKVTYANQHCKKSYLKENTRVTKSIPTLQILLSHQRSSSSVTSALTERMVEAFRNWPAQRWNQRYYNWQAVVTYCLLCLFRSLGLSTRNVHTWLANLAFCVHSEFGHALASEYSSARTECRPDGQNRLSGEQRFSRADSATTQWDCLFCSGRPKNVRQISRHSPCSKGQP